MLVAVLGCLIHSHLPVISIKSWKFVKLILVYFLRIKSRISSLHTLIAHLNLGAQSQNFGGLGDPGLSCLGCLWSLVTRVGVQGLGLRLKQPEIAADTSENERSIGKKRVLKPQTKFSPILLQDRSLLPQHHGHHSDLYLRIHTGASLQIHGLQTPQAYSGSSYGLCAEYYENHLYYGLSELWSLFWAP